MNAITSTLSRRLRRRSRYPIYIALVASVATAIAGCGSTTSRNQVASLGNQSASSHKSSAQASEGIPDPDGRTRETLDETTNQLEALIAPFDTCVFTEHNPGAKNSGYNARLLAASEACIRTAPLPPWQLDPSNPQARAFIGRTVTCLQQHGYHAMAALSQSPFGNVTQSWIVNYSPAVTGIQPATESAQQSCEREANE